MGFIFKIGNLFISRPLGMINAAIDGKKTYLASALIVLPGLTCLIQLLLSLMPLDLNDLNTLLHSDCMKQIGEGLAVAGLGHKLEKAS